MSIEPRTCLIAENNVYSNLNWGGRVIFCHQHRKSINKIEGILTELAQGKTKEYYYEAKTGEHSLGVTVSPFEIDGKPIGFIQCFSVKRANGDKKTGDKGNAK